MKPQFGFGKKGKPSQDDEGVVPPNATLEITLELVSWKTVLKVTDDKKVLKKIVKEREGYECHNDGAIVKLKLIGVCIERKKIIQPPIQNQWLERENIGKKYKNGISNVRELEENGCLMLYGVDAKEMSNHFFLRTQRFAHIVYNFPHVGFHYPENSNCQIQLNKSSSSFSRLLI
ncbi:hypothetical protein TanjilG_15034 [Lupinus angustifolius]|uniref:peptidylprolyl isomerase n=1 Tax=Lupinus angustifolius TaxID=3871 RepID=A0A1J7FVE0_LUPAN|nr:hypothetical protein TanjilG_15034 [Lupinus angustifolius]